MDPIRYYIHPGEIQWNREELLHFHAFWLGACLLSLAIQYATAFGKRTPPGYHESPEPLPE